MNFDNNSNYNDFDNSIIDLNSFSTASNGGNDKKPKKKANSSRKAKIIKITLSVFLVGVITACLVMGAFLIYAFTFVDATMEENLDDLALEFTTTIYAADSKGEFHPYQSLHGEYNREWVADTDGNIPSNLKHAFIAIEDKRFKSHKGVDWKRTISAFANLFFHFYSSNQGGSTITQQLVKNLTGDNSSSPARKVREIMRAHYLEERYSKDTILECYLNTVSMAGGMYGVEVASNYYFNKSTKDLDLLECAALASIVKAPEQYRPDKHPERNKERRQTVLTEMYKQNYITKEEYDAVYDKELTVIADKKNLQELPINSYFVDALIDDVIEGLMEVYGFDKTHASNNFYNGGYKIYATIDPNVQSAIDEVFYNSKYSYKGKDGSLLQGSMTVIDYNGNVLGMAGGIGEKTANRGLNRALQAIRQPGSTIKPLTAYAPAIEKDLITYSSILDDTERYYGKDEYRWKPNNWYNNGGYYGKITVEYALERSCNTIPVALVDTLTTQKSYDFLVGKLGFKNLNANDINYSPLGMGGTNGGVTTFEEAAAYAVFGNGGIYNEPRLYFKVCDHDDQVILQSETNSNIAISEDTATVMNHLLQNVVYGAEGTGRQVKTYLTHKIFAKTGTSNDDMNCWFTGGTPYCVGSVWCGYDTLQKVSQNDVAKVMWREVMSRVHKNLPAKEFVDSAYAVSKEYCTSSGLLATDACPKKKTGWYKVSNVPTMCTKHPSAPVTNDAPSTDAATPNE